MKRIILAILIPLIFGLLAGCASLNAADSLHNAAEVGDINAVKDHLKKGLDVNARDSVGWTALMRAVSYGHTEIVKVLIAKGADIDAAIAGLEGFAINDPRFASEYKYGISLLKRIKVEGAKEALKKEKEQEIANAKAIEAQKAKEMKDLIKEVVKESSLQKADSKATSSMQSDIDKPSFTSSDKLMSDNDLAVIIGIEGYKSLPKSDYSFDDAKLVKEYVKALGIKERNIEFLTDDNATKSAFEKSFEAWLKNKAKPDSRVFVYYSGHGAPDTQTGEAYLVPYDGDLNYLNVTGYSLKRLYDNLGRLQVKEVVVVLDSCFSGAGGRSVLAQGARPLVMMTTSTVLPSNIAVISATQGTQISTSSIEKGHGVFTYYFLKAIKDGKKTIAGIYEYIKPLVEDEAKQINVQQSPSVSPDVEKLKGKFILKR